MKEGGSFLQKRRLLRAMRRASELPSQASRMSDAELAEAELDIERLRLRVDDADRAAEAARSALAKDLAVDGPEQCDWSLRPDLWKSPIRPRGAVAIPSPTALSPEITIYHDCPAPELSYRQIRAAKGVARYHLALEVYRFGGGFLSLAQTLPDAAIEGLTRSHFFVVTLELDCEEPLEIYSRLNLQSGPNTEQLVREMPVKSGFALAEFDLAYTKINEKRMEKVWLDLILEAPQMNRVLIRDMTITRAPRADI
ncbi:MAG: DUF6478 family protein [Pseudomonadota bacterium]